MAIQVNGTTVIDNSRNLTNIASVDAATVAAFGAAGVGGGGAPSWSPTLTPDVTLTSSGTWTKPASLGADDWVVFYMVGGGGSGTISSWSTGANGGNATIFSAKAGTLPSSISFTVGAGGSGGALTDLGNAGGDTTASVNGRLYTAKGGLPGYGTGSNYTSQLNDEQLGGSFTVPFDGTSPNDYDSNATKGGRGTKGASYTSAAYFVQANAILGGAGGAGAVLNSTISSGGVSVYAGNGGSSNGASVAANSGATPGGGGGGDYGGSNAGNGGNGSVRIYYV